MYSMYHISPPLHRYCVLLFCFMPLLWGFAHPNFLKTKCHLCIEVLHPWWSEILRQGPCFDVAFSRSALGPYKDMRQVHCAYRISPEGTKLRLSGIYRENEIAPKSIWSFAFLNIKQLQQGWALSGNPEVLQQIKTIPGLVLQCCLSHLCQILS